MSEYVIKVDENDERWHYVERQYTHFFGYPITEEIVRCRDCRRYDDQEPGGGIGTCNLGLEDLGLLSIVEPDGFCKWGERK